MAFEASNLARTNAIPQSATALSLKDSFHCAMRIGPSENTTIDLTFPQMAKACAMEVSREVTRSPADTGLDNSGEAHPHADHDYDPSNPHYFGLPLGVIIAATISAIAVSITLLKFF